MSDMECPYCGDQQEVNHDDGHGYAEGVKHHHYCTYCGKAFVFETFIHMAYEPARADCLNDGQHVWTPTQTWPKHRTRMVCSHCDEEREPTAEEKATHSIPEYR